VTASDSSRGDSTLKTQQPGYRERRNNTRRPVTQIKVCLASTINFKAIPHTKSQRVCADLCKQLQSCRMHAVLKVMGQSANHYTTIYLNLHTQLLTLKAFKKRALGKKAAMGKLGKKYDSTLQPLLRVAFRVSIHQFPIHLKSENLCAYGQPSVPLL
jgi:hypothetical protein